MRLAMIPMRIVADWLSDGTNGVNAELAAMTTDDLDTSDTVPPNVATIIDESRDGNAALKLIPDDLTLPALLIFQSAAFAIPIALSQGKLKAEVGPIAIAYAVKSSKAEEGKEDAFYTMDAVVRSLNNLFVGNDATRVRAGIQLVNLRQLELAPMEEERGSAMLTLALITRFQVHDTRPT